MNAANKIDQADAWEANVAKQQSLESGNVALWLRWAGAVAVAASAVVYMLQGMNNIDLDMRNWVYLGLMALMGACGVASQKFMQDAKGTRLFFGLAALLIPVQFSQLGGLVHELATVPGAVVPHLLWLGLGTLVLALPVAYAALSILARADRRVLLPALMLLSAALLLPGRASIEGFVVLAGIVIATLLVEVRVLRATASYQSLDGRGLRLLLAAPMVIAAVRLSLAIDSAAGFAAMGGIFALILSRISATSGLLRGIAALLGTFSWFVYVLDAHPAALWGQFGPSLLCLPVAIWLLDLSRLSVANGGFLRGLASLLVMVAGLSLLLQGDAYLSLLALVQGVLTLGFGVQQNKRAPVFAGSIVSAGALMCLLISSLTSVEVNIWIALGLGGVALVFSASLLEKYGRMVVGNSKRVWQSVAAWD